MLVYTALQLSGNYTLQICMKLIVLCGCSVYSIGIHVPGVGLIPEMNLEKNDRNKNQVVHFFVFV